MRLLAAGGVVLLGVVAAWVTAWLRMTRYDRLTMTQERRQMLIDEETAQRTGDEIL